MSMPPRSAMEAVEPATATVTRARRNMVIFAVIALLLSGGLYLVWRAVGRGAEPGVLQVSGRLEGYETNLSPKIGGRVEFIKAREGDAVNAGEVLARLSDSDYQAQLRGAEARILAARQSVLQNTHQLSLVKAQIYGASKRLSQAQEESAAQISQGHAGLSEAQERLRQSEADLAQAQSDLQLASIRLKRYTELVKKGAVTKDEYDQACTTYQSYAALVGSRRSGAQAALKAVSSAQAVLKQNIASRYTPPIRYSDLSVSEAQLDQAQNGLQAAEDQVSNAIAERDQVAANIDYLIIHSPINGIVTARPVEPGAVLSPGQTVLTVLDYSQVYMRGYVPEGKIGAVKIGCGAKVYLDAMPGRPFNGKVIEIDPEASFTPENIYFKDDRVKQVFGIKIGLDSPGGYAKPGMPADAVIDL